MNFCHEFRHRLFRTSVFLIIDCSTFFRKGFREHEASGLPQRAAEEIDYREEAARRNYWRRSGCGKIFVTFLSLSHFAGFIHSTHNKKS